MEGVCGVISGCAQSGLRLHRVETDELGARPWWQWERSAHCFVSSRVAAAPHSCSATRLAVNPSCSAGNHMYKVQLGVTGKKKQKKKNFCRRTLLQNSLCVRRCADYCFRIHSSCIRIRLSMSLICITFCLSQWDVCDWQASDRPLIAKDISLSPRCCKIWKFDMLRWHFNYAIQTFGSMLAGFHHHNLRSWHVIVMQMSADAFLQPQLCLRGEAENLGFSLQMLSHLEDALFSHLWDIIIDCLMLIVFCS